MEPRIAQLLGTSNPETYPYDSISPAVVQSGPHRPRPVEPSSDQDGTQTPGKSISNGFLTNRHHVPYNSSGRQTAGAPIAQVLNNEPQYLNVPQPGLTVLTSPTTPAPFSGRLGDLLLDGTEPVSHKRKHESHVQSSHADQSSSVIKLPEPPQLPKKTTKRPRIPPLLQGLHQPPPLPPEGRLFPPITSEKNDFTAKAGERVGFEIYADESRAKADDEYVTPGTGASGSSTTNEAQRYNTTSQSLEGARTPPPKRVDSEEALQATIQEKVVKKQSKKRNKWTDEETKDLLVGVSKYGIGSWKKILGDSDYHFNGRTAVDLKDRFRVCCPGDAPKTRKKGKNSDNVSERKAEPSTIEKSKTADKNVSVASARDREAELDSRNHQAEIVDHKIVTSDLAELGITGPFPKSNRRARRKFTDHDDKNLLKGFEKHGASWHAMREDSELGFRERHPTDLRDRFRLMFPEKYANAGYKLRPVDDQNVLNRTKKDEKEPEVEVPFAGLLTPARHEKQAEAQGSSGNKYTNSSLSISTSTVPTNQNTRSTGHIPNFSDAIFGSDTEDMDNDGDQSPIVLDNYILQWAGTDPSSLPPFNAPQASVHNSFTIPTDTDGLHINPQATLKLPTAPTYPTTISPSRLMPTISTPLPPNRSNNLPLAATSSTMPSSKPPATTEGHSSQLLAPPQSSHTHTSSSKRMPRTPNLPTIVFPYVPARSARSTVHNLPTPADLLLGVDQERTSDTQTLGLGLGMGLDETFNFGL